MEVMLEPVHGRVRASSGAPLNIDIEASDEAEAMAMMRDQVDLRLKEGVKIVEIVLPVSNRSIPIPGSPCTGFSRKILFSRNGN